MIAKATSAASEKATECAPAVLAEINLARTDPKAYAAHVKPMLALFEGKVLKRPGEMNLVTQEGAVAVNDCVKFLEAAEHAGRVARRLDHAPLAASVVNVAARAGVAHVAAQAQKRELVVQRREVVGRAVALIAEALEVL